MEHTMPNYTNKVDNKTSTDSTDKDEKDENMEYDEQKRTLQKLLPFTSGIMFVPSADFLVGSLKNTTDYNADVIRDTLNLCTPLKDPRTEHKTHNGAYILLDGKMAKQIIGNNDPVKILEDEPEKITKHQLYAGEATADISKRAKQGCTFSTSLPKNGWAHPMMEFWYGDNKVIEWGESDEEKIDFSHIKSMSDISVYLIGAPENTFNEKNELIPLDRDVPENFSHKLENAIKALGRVTSEHGWAHYCEKVSSKGRHESPTTMFNNFIASIESKELEPDDMIQNLEKWVQVMLAKINYLDALHSEDDVKETIHKLTEARLIFSKNTKKEK